MKFAHIENGVVTEVVAVDPFQIFGESYASTFIECGDDVKAGYTYENGILTAPPVKTPAEILAEAKLAFVKSVDTDVDRIYRDALGDRGPEYTLAEQEAKAYKAAGYSGTVPESVQAWADAKGQTATWATDDIVTQATQWRSAQSAMRTKRLAEKEAGRAATTLVQLDLVRARWDAFVTYIRGLLSI